MYAFSNENNENALVGTGRLDCGRRTKGARITFVQHNKQATERFEILFLLFVYVAYSVENGSMHIVISICK